MRKKLHALIRSRRFWLAVAGLVFVTTDGFGLNIPPEQVQMIVLTLAAWIVGDSLRVTE